MTIYFEKVMFLAFIKMLLHITAPTAIKIIRISKKIIPSLFFTLELFMICEVNSRQPATIILIKYVKHKFYLLLFILDF